MKRNFFVYILLFSMLSQNVVFAATQSANPPTTDWFVYEYPKADDIKGGILDVSDLLEAPAGKHGYLTKTEGENFYFEDGTEIRFWGINLTSSACYPSHENAIESAKRIAQSGFNLVRLHLLDSGFDNGIWGPKTEGGRVLKEDTMDRICFLVSELKKRGIYVMIDLVISWPLNSDMPFHDLEHLNDGLKQYSYFDEAMISESKKYTDQLLSYYNKYTGLSFKDDPVMALIDLKNEDIISGVYNLDSNYYTKKIQARYNTWLFNKYGTREAIKEVWVGDNQHTGLRDTENLTDGTIELFSEVPEWQFSEARVIDKTVFLSIIQEEFYKNRIDDMRSQGVKCLITGVTCGSRNGLERTVYYSNRNTDFIDTHNYVSNVSSIFYQDGTERFNVPASMLSEKKAGLVGDMWMRKVFGKPNTISEWNDIAPSKYRSESLLLVSAYSSLQGTNPFCFAWKCIGNIDTSVTTDNYVKSCFGVADTPEFLAALPAAARIFLRGDVKEAESGYYPIRMQDNEIFSSLLQYINIRQLNYFLGFIGKTGMSFTGYYDENANNNTVLQLANNAYNNNTPFVSMTGELSTDYTNKLFLMNTEKSQAVSGFVSGKTAVLDDVDFQIDNYFATLYLNSVKNVPINQSDRLLLTVTGDTRNSGMTFSEDETKIIKAGAAPVLVEPITGTVNIKTTSPITVYPLTTSGTRKAAIATTKTSNGYSFIMQASHKTMHYEIVKSSNEKNTHISLGNTAATDVFSDIGDTNPQKNMIERMALTDCIGPLNGNNFSPNSTITRKDFIKLMVRALYLGEKVWYDKDNDNFDDLANNADGFAEMAIAWRLNIIKKEAGTLIWKKNSIKPNTPMTRGTAMQYAAKLLMASYRTKKQDSSFSLSQYTDGNTSDANAEYYKLILGLGYLSGKNNKIAAGDSITRAEATEMAYRIAWK